MYTWKYANLLHNGIIHFKSIVVLIMKYAIIDCKKDFYTICTNSVKVSKNDKKEFSHLY